MERNDKSCAGRTRDAAGLARGEIMPAGRMVGILVEKYAFDEQLGRVGRQCRDALDIVRVKGDVGHIADLLALNLPQDRGLEQPKGQNTFVLAAAVAPAGA